MRAPLTRPWHPGWRPLYSLASQQPKPARRMSSVTWGTAPLLQRSPCCRCSLRRGSSHPGWSSSHRWHCKASPVVLLRATAAFWQQVPHTAQPQPRLPMLCSIWCPSLLRTALPQPSAAQWIISCIAQTALPKTQSRTLLCCTARLAPLAFGPCIWQCWQPCNMAA
jgi:hypothetical protein